MADWASRSEVERGARRVRLSGVKPGPIGEPVGAMAIPRGVAGPLRCFSAHFAPSRNLVCMPIIVKHHDQPDETYDYGSAGDLGITYAGDSMVARSVMHPGWSWDEHVKPHTDGDESCQMTHHEYVVSGRIRYLTDEGDEVVAGPGDHLWIGPGHRAWVVGDEPCVTVDFEVGEPDDEDDGEE
jgi:quercetin dioxygenase-like cupin family protein